MNIDKLYYFVGSLLQYGAKYLPAALSRATLMNFRLDGAIRNYPLYAVSRFPALGSGLETGAAEGCG